MEDSMEKRRKNSILRLKNKAFNANKIYFSQY